MASDIECSVLKVLPIILARGAGLAEKWDLLIRELRYPIKLIFPLAVIWAVWGSFFGWVGHDGQGLTGPIAKTGWVFAALIPWASYFRFAGIRRIFAALDFLLVSLPAHIGCMMIYLEGAAIGLWRVVCSRFVLDDSRATRIWVPTGTKYQNKSSIPGDLLRYLIPGTAIAISGMVLSRWMLMSIGTCMITQWLATRGSFKPRVGAIAVRVAGLGIVLTLLEYVVSPASDCVSDLIVLSLAVVIF